MKEQDQSRKATSSKPHSTLTELEPCLLTPSVTLCGFTAYPLLSSIPLTFCCFVNKSRLTLLWPCRLQPARLLCPWDFLGKKTGLGCHFLLQGIFPSQGSNLHLLLDRSILYHWVTWEALPTPVFLYKPVAGTSTHSLSSHLPPWWGRLLKSQLNLNCTRETSLVDQWLRVHLPMQGTWVLPLVWKIPHTEEHLSPWAATTEPTRVPQWLKPVRPRAGALQQEKPPQWEAWASPLE